MSRSPSVVQHLERTDEYVVSVWRRLMLLVWRDKANAGGVERSRELFEEWVARQPGDAAVLIVVPGKRTREPDQAAMAAMLRTAKDPVPQCKGMATLVEVEGFIAASVQSLMMRLHASNAREDAAHVFGSVPAAASWAARLLGDKEITSASLARAIGLAREG